MYQTKQDYLEFVQGKLATPITESKLAGDLHPNLFPFQAALVRWALRKGRSALFCDTGLGKTFMQLEWAKHVGGRVLIIAPLSVARQTCREAERWGYEITLIRGRDAVAGDGIYITNYEMAEKVGGEGWAGVVLDESSILKSFTGKTRALLIQMFRDTKYRLCCTATPSPNDISEIANHSEFLGVMTRTEMLAMFFLHDDKGWRLKRHAESAFYKWMASWGMSVRKPSDIGDYDDTGYLLPPLTTNVDIVDCEVQIPGALFAYGMKGIVERADVRRSTEGARCERAAELVNGTADQWVVWHGLNTEGRILAKLIPDAVLVEGSQTPEVKAELMDRFLFGDARVLITKPSIGGFGINMQRCHHMAFVGLSDSFEQYYQAVRRCWRFGQESPVDVHIILSEPETAIWDNVQQKESRDVERVTKMIDNLVQYEEEEIQGTTAQGAPYVEDDAEGDGWKLMLGDSAERLKEVGADSVGFSIFSPPFATLYTYSASERDLGNSRDYEDFFQHLSYITDELYRVMMPGRSVAVHCAQLPTTQQTDGVIGMKDFRGDLIRHYAEHGFIYHGEVCIDKDPQAQAIRTHSKSLLFVQLRKDSSWMRPAFADYLLIMRKPGDNQEPVHPDISNDDWIEWARPIWYNIRESNTLNAAEARGDKDERHICPLQLDTIERAIRLWSNPGELVLSPFAGIGSEGYEAVLTGRRFVGVELKPEYFRTAVKNLGNAERLANQDNLFASAGIEIH